MLDGKIAFKLYDTYGFPFDLTQDILKSKNININEFEFKKEMGFSCQWVSIFNGTKSTLLTIFDWILCVKEV